MRNFDRSRDKQKDNWPVKVPTGPEPEHFFAAKPAAVLCIQLRAETARDPRVKLIVQPEDGVKPLVNGIDNARKSVEIAIFRFDRKEVEHALENAVKRGVFVHTLIADTNRSGEKNLRKLEMRLLAKGVTVARTSDDLVRYHGKMMIVDRKELYVLAFNFTHLDIDHSRSFGIVTRNRQLVQEAIRLFESDTKRQPYTPRCSKFLVSPVNAREQLSAFIKGAKHELLIYDSKISDRAMIRLLEERARAGVDIRIVGRGRAGIAGLMCANFRRRACTPAPSFGTVTRCSSEARAFANWNWTHGGRLESSFAIPKW